MSELNKRTCGYHIAWVGSCKNTELLENGQCEKHQEKCSFCENLAIDSCDHTGFLVCGAPLCKKCKCKH